MSRIFHRYSAVLLMAAGLVFAFLTGCLRKDGLQPEQTYMPSLVDTLYPGVERQCVLTDGLGDYLYDDVFQRPQRSEYGFSRLERRLLAGWEILSAEGQSLLDEPEYAVVHPDWLLRRYSSGLTVEVFVPWRCPGMLVTIGPSQRGGVIFRPVFDIRLLDQEESPEYWAPVSARKKAVSVCRRDSLGGWMAVAGENPCKLRLIEKQHRAHYPLSEMTGRPGVVVGWSAGEFLNEKNGFQRYAFGWGADSGAAFSTALDILDKREKLREERGQRTVKLLSDLSLRCEDKTFERAFAWARLMVHNLQYEKDRASYLLTGLPLSPWPDGWHTCLSIEGAVAAGVTLEQAYRFLETIADARHPQDGSISAGMFPGAIHEEGPEYRIPEIAGLAAAAYGKLRGNFVEPSADRDDKMAIAFAEDLMGTCRQRLSVGLAQSTDNASFLWNGSSSPARSGATIETQLLFYKLRVWLRAYPRIHTLIIGLPLSLIDGAGESACGREWMEYVTATTDGEFRVPILRNCVLIPFGDFQSMDWSDRLTFSADPHTPGRVLPERHAERRISIPLALGWYDKSDRRKAVKTLLWAQENEMIGLAGFRSLSPLEPDYQSGHVYQYEDDPEGTLANGDVLIWSAGLLGDLLATTEQFNSMWGLVDQLTRRVIGQSVYGGLSEAENAEPDDLERDAVGSGLHLTSTAEYARLVSDHLIGIDQRRGPYLMLRPNMPPQWGNTTLSFERGSGRVTLNRLSDREYRLHQTGVEPFLSIALEVSPEPGAHAIGSLRLYPGDEAFVIFRYEEGGFWQAVIKRK